MKMIFLQNRKDHPGNVDDLVAGMRQYVENPDLIADHGAASRKLAEEKFDVEKVNPIMLKEMEIGTSV